MISPSARHRPKSTKSAYLPEVFDLMTDILADLVLEDIPVQKKVEKAGKVAQVDQYW